MVKTGLWKSLGFTFIFALGIILYAYQMNIVYYHNNLTKGDSTYTYYYAGTLLQVAKTLNLPDVIITFLQWPDPKSQTILYYLMVLILSPFLKVSTSIGPILNGIWYLLMAVSLCLFFWHKTRNVSLSALFPIPLLIAGLPLNDVYQGLTDLHVNLLSYTLSTSTICFVLISDYLRKPWPALLAGSILGLLVLGRVFTVALVGIAIIPIVLQGTIFSSKTDRIRTLRGIGIFVGVTLLISGWWLIPRLADFIEKPFRVQGAPGASIGVGSLLSIAEVWFEVIKDFFFYNVAYYPLAFVLFWIGGVQIISAQNIKSLLKRVNWIYFWLGFSPLFVLLLMRSDYKYYGWPALIGLYLTVLFPSRSVEKGIETLKKPIFKWILIVALICAILGFTLDMYSTHNKVLMDKQSALQAVNAILDDPEQKNRSRTEITVGLAYYGDLNIGSLANVFVFDENCPVAPLASLPDFGVLARTDCSRISMPNEITQWPQEWDPDVMKNEKVTVASAADAMYRMADYVVILAPESWETEAPTYKKYWPEWVELSKELYYSETFHPITSTLTITSLEKVMVLSRVSP